MCSEKKPEDFQRVSTAPYCVREGGLTRAAVSLLKDREEALLKFCLCKYAFFSPDPEWEVYQNPKRKVRIQGTASTHRPNWRCPAQSGEEAGSLSRWEEETLLYGAASKSHKCWLTRDEPPWLKMELGKQFPKSEPYPVFYSLTVKQNLRGCSVDNSYPVLKTPRTGYTWLGCTQRLAQGTEQGEAVGREPGTEAKQGPWAQQTGACLV